MILCSVVAIIKFILQLYCTPSNLKKGRTGLWNTPISFEERITAKWSKEIKILNTSITNILCHECQLIRINKRLGESEYSRIWGELPGFIS